jgi:ATP-dependent Zn protease
MIRDRVNGILSDELNNAARIIRDNKLAMDTRVQALLEKSHLKENEIDEIFSRTARIA